MHLDNLTVRMSFFMLILLFSLTALKSRSEIICIEVEDVDLEDDDPRSAMATYDLGWLSPLSPLQKKTVDFGDGKIRMLGKRSPIRLLGNTFHFPLSKLIPSVTVN